MLTTVSRSKMAMDVEDEEEVDEVTGEEEVEDATVVFMHRERHIDKDKTEIQSILRALRLTNKDITQVIVRTSYLNYNKLPRRRREIHKKLMNL